MKAQAIKAGKINRPYFFDVSISPARLCRRNLRPPKHGHTHHNHTEEQLLLLYDRFMMREHPWLSQTLPLQLFYLLSFHTPSYYALYTQEQLSSKGGSCAGCLDSGTQSRCSSACQRVQRQEKGSSTQHWKSRQPQWSDFKSCGVLLHQLLLNVLIEAAMNGCGYWFI